ncbi:hypothetical protein P879_01929 [Paragonimus westermani]|uniref:Uncharacterized protein n=1 Tax=Paragonimus westermani TaxID=34504 RepID=A0A8T0DML4_9TREM|nr:hypothetical protein P879_01929 [Paragonimus westermani]
MSSNIVGEFAEEGTKTYNYCLYQTVTLRPVRSASNLQLNTRVAKKSSRSVEIARCPNYLFTDAACF